MSRLAVLVAAVCVLVTAPAAEAQQDTAATASTSARADAYADERAREMVRLARERRAMFDSRIRAYSATAVERLTIGLRAGIAERLAYRRESASRIDWTLDTVRIEVLGARAVVPPFSGALQIPEDLQSYMPSLAFDPVDSEMMLRLDSTNLRHPLAAGSEAYYRFSSGDSSVITLPDGRSVRLHELRIQPRRRDPQLISGSFWLDAATNAVVQAYFRQSRGYEAELDAEDCGVTCRIGLALVRPVRMELEYIAIDYGLWDLHWWLPRSIAASGVIQGGRFGIPIRFERRYDDYTVTGDTSGLVTAADSTMTRPCRPRVSFSIGVSSAAPPDSMELARRDSVFLVRRDSAIAHRRAAQLERGDTAAAAAGAERDACDRTFIVTTAHPDSLLGSSLLPADIYGSESGVLSGPALEAIADGLRRIPSPVWQVEAPVLRLPSDVRYNRVEGLSAGVGVRMDFGQLSGDAEVGIGTGDRRLRGELGITRAGRSASTRLGGYVRLAGVDADAGPFSTGSSINAFLFGRDDHEYFRTRGLELTVRPSPARTRWYDLRLFVERQRSAAVTTDLSVPHLLDDGRGFRPNGPADDADQIGGTVVLRTGRWFNPAAFRWAAELELHGEAGDFEFVRPAARLRTAVPLGRLELTTELAGGSSFGGAPVQRDWLLGGRSTLRGYSAASARGEAFWRGRVELAAGLPFMRLAIFGDIGHAGPRGSLRTARPLRSAGLGVTLLDGLIRLDIARPFDGGGWRLHSGIGMQ